VSFSTAGDTAVRASWSSDAEGAAKCTGSFTVQDAQGRQSSGDRDGQVVLDLRGLPADPTRVEWTAFGDDTVTLRVTSDAASYPSVEGYRITTNGREVATCPASGACAPIDAPVGEKRTYEAQAVSSVGTSRGSVRTEAWAYRAPAQPTGASFDPVPAGNGGGVATVVITGLDATTGSVRLTGGAAGSATQAVAGSVATFTGYQVGSNDPTALTATPLTQFDLPPIAGGSTEGRSREVRAHGVGAPSIELSQTTTADSMSVNVRVTAQSAGTETLFGYSEQSAAACTPNTRESSRTFPAEAFREKTIWVCATSTFGGDSGFGVAESNIKARPSGSVEAPDGMTFTVSADPRGNQRNGFTYSASDHTSPGDKPFDDAELRYYLNGSRVSDFAPRYNQPGDRWSARWCDSFLGIDTNCSDPISISPAAGSADYPIQVSTNDVPSCRSDEAVPEWRPSGFGADVATVTREVEEGLFGPRRVTWTVQWIGALQGLNSVSVTADCREIEPPEPPEEPVDPVDPGDPGEPELPVEPGTGGTAPDPTDTP
jgi:large repetitive protein